MIQEGCRALVINLAGKHELHASIVYVECLLHDSPVKEDRVFGVIGGYYSNEYHLEDKYLLLLDDSDDLVIEYYTDK